MPRNPRSADSADSYLMFGGIIACLFGGACFYATTRIDEDNVRRLLTVIGLGLIVLGSIAAMARSVLRLIKRFGGD